MGGGIHCRAGRGRLQRPAQGMASGKRHSNRDGGAKFRAGGADEHEHWQLRVGECGCVHLGLAQPRLVTRQPDEPDLHLVHRAKRIYRQRKHARLGHAILSGSGW